MEYYAGKKNSCDCWSCAEEETKKSNLTKNNVSEQGVLNIIKIIMRKKRRKWKLLRRKLKDKKQSIASVVFL